MTSQDRCPGYTFKNTSTKADEAEGKLGGHKPDITLFADHDVGAVDAWKELETESAQPKKYEDPQYTRADMGFAASFIEIKRLKTYDCFNDPPKGGSREKWQFVLPDKQRNRDKAVEALGQNIAYAAEILRRQHRHCCYSVFVFGRRARLARWDRAGAIVTEAFDLIDNPLPLCEFFEIGSSE